MHMTDDEPGVTITLAKIYDIVITTADDVSLIKRGLPDTAAQLLDHETRLRHLETRIGWAVGAFGLIAFVAPFLATLIQ